MSQLAATLVLKGVSIDSIEVAVRDLFIRELGSSAEKLTVETQLPDLNIPSVKLLRIIAKLEKQYRIELDDDVLFRVETVRDLAAVVAARLK